MPGDALAVGPREEVQRPHARDRGVDVNLCPEPCIAPLPVRSAWCLGDHLPSRFQVPIGRQTILVGTAVMHGVMPAVDSPPRASFRRLTTTPAALAPLRAGPLRVS